MPDEPAEPLEHLRAHARPVGPDRPDVGDDARDEQRPQREAGRVRRERDGRANREQERADGRQEQLVRQDERALHPGVGDAEVLAGDETRDQRAARGVGERLRRAEDEQGEQHEGDIHGPASDRSDECHEHERATKVHHDDHSLPVESVGGHAADDAEHEHRQVLAQQGHRDEERGARHRGDKQRPGGDRDAVAGVVDERCREQPAEAPTEPRRRDGLADPGEK